MSAQPALGAADTLVSGFRRIAVAIVLALCTTLSALAVGPALARAAGSDGSGYYVTFVARWCHSYSDIFANRARNDIVESLEDLGPDTQYGNSGALINPAYEQEAPQNRCVPLPHWQFTLGTGYQSRAVTGVWGSLSKVTGAFPTSIVTQDSTPLLDDDAKPVSGQRLAGATTIELTDAERSQASQAAQLWAQGGTPADPVLAQQFPGPEFGFGTLRCATDNLNGDNVEYIFFPQGVHHVFCYAFYVKPPPTTGIITIKKQVVGAPAGTQTAFPFSGTISFNPDGFQLSNGGSLDFYRAGGSTWTVTEGAVAGYRLESIGCRAVTEAGTPGQSLSDVSGSTVSIDLVALEHVTCLFTNQYVPPSGGLTIQKVTSGAVGTFRYVVTPASGGGGVHRVSATTQEQDVPVDAEPSLLTLAPGTYTIRELSPQPAGGTWRLHSVVCNGLRLPTNATVKVVIRSGSEISCLFTNVFTPKGSISVAKITHGATGKVGFLITPVTGPPAQYLQTAITTTQGVAAAATPDTSADATDQIPLGAYRIAEQAPVSTAEGSWSLTDVTCNGEIVPFDQGTATVDLTAAAPDTHCVFSDAFSPVTPPEPPAPPGPTPDPGDPYADLAVTKTAAAPTVESGQVASFHITVSNRGPDDAESVELIDQPRSPATVVSVHTDTGSCRTGSPIVCELGTLKPGAKVQITVGLRLTMPPVTFTNRAVVGSATYDPNMRNNAAAASVDVVAPAAPGRG